MVECQPQEEETETPRCRYPMTPDLGVTPGTLDGAIARGGPRRWPIPDARSIVRKYMGRRASLWTVKAAGRAGHPGGALTPLGDQARDPPPRPASREKVFSGGNYSGGR